MNYGIVTDGSDSARISTRERVARKIDHRPNVPGRWVYLVTGDSELDTDESPAYLNSTTFAGPPFDYPAFRSGLDGALEWKGHVDVSGASSPAVMCVLPTRWIPDYDVSWLTDLVSGSGFVVARVSVNSTTGAVTLTWPAG